jgi:DNA-3-methyladenine glycosylase I
MYTAYHDLEWGVPVGDDAVHFEFLVLEGAQAGLSWRTVLRKRNRYREVLAGFDPRRVAAFGPADVERLLADPGIVRNRRKVESAIHNARRFLAVQDEFGSFAAYVWAFVDGRPKVGAIRALADYAATSPESDALSKDLRRRGFSFVGSTIVYAHMQATGLVNDHSLDCFRREEILAMRFSVPAAPTGRSPGPDRPA